MNSIKNQTTDPKQNCRILAPCYQTHLFIVLPLSEMKLKPVKEELPG